jgi:hypothetical protein
VGELAGKNGGRPAAFCHYKASERGKPFFCESVDMCEILMSVCARDVVCAIVFGGRRPAPIFEKATDCLGNPPSLQFAPLLSEFLQALDLINALDENKLAVIVKRLVKNVGEKSASFTAQELEQLQDHLQLAEGQVDIVVFLSLLCVWGGVREFVRAGGFEIDHKSADKRINFCV